MIIRDGTCNLSAPGADLTLARLAARHRVPLGVSTVASTPMGKIISTAEGYAWFQLYFSCDGSGTFKLVERAKSAGYRTLVLTDDVPEVGRRPRELPHGFTMPFRIGPRQLRDFALHPRWSLSMLVSGRPEMANFEMPGNTFDRTESPARADWDTLSRLRDAWSGNSWSKACWTRKTPRPWNGQGSMQSRCQATAHGSLKAPALPSRCCRRSETP